MTRQLRYGDPHVIEMIARHCLTFAHAEEPGYTLKSGQTSTHYIDLRKLMGFPKTLARIADMIASHISGPRGTSFEIEAGLKICGVPYGGIPIATLVSQAVDRSLLLIRKHTETPKSYGLANAVEGASKARVELTCS